MSWVAAAVIGSSVVGGVLSGNAQEDAANTAAGAQTAASQASIAQQDKQFQAIQKLLEPFATGGTKAFGAQQDLIGLNGGTAQQSAIDALKASPRFTSALQAGNENILQNASATGGLRGGNTQAALAQFSPQLLAQLINDQYSQLGGLSSVGQNAAAGVGNAGMNNANQVSALLQQQGAATAGAALAGGRAQAGIYNGIAGGIGGYFGSGGKMPSFGSSGGADWGFGSLPAGTF